MLMVFVNNCCIYPVYWVRAYTNASWWTATSVRPHKLHYIEEQLCGLQFVESQSVGCYLTICLSLRELTASCRQSSLVISVVKDSLLHSHLYDHAFEMDATDLIIWLCCRNVVLLCNLMNWQQPEKIWKPRVLKSTMNLYDFFLLVVI